MSQIGISDIKDYNSLLSAYSRLKNEGDKTTSAKNAKVIFRQNIDIDGDNTAELWELMQKANEAHNRIIFNEIKTLKQVQNNKYPQISDDNPINIILSIESEVVGEEKTKKAYTVINDIIRTAKEKINSKASPAEKLGKLYGIVRKDFDIQYGELNLLSEGLAKKRKKVDCDTGSFVFVAVAHELGWPAYFAVTLTHAFIIWRFNENQYLGFETTNGETFVKKDCDPVRREAKLIVRDRQRYFFSIAHNNRGEEYEGLGKHNMAISDFTKAIELKPDSANAYYNRGGAYYKLGKYAQAISDITKAIKLQPDRADAYFTRGVIYNELDKYAQAVSDYTKAIELNPDYAEAYINRGNTYSELDKYAQAISDYTKAFIIKRTMHWPNIIVAMCL